jgi:ATP-dependent DNA helicase RecG
VFRLLNLAEQFLRESLPIAGRVVPHLFERADDPLEPHESLPWNPMMARVFHRRGIIESCGRGTIKMVELAEKAGQPRPEIEESGGCVVVRFQPGRYVAPQQIKRDLTKRQRSILQFLATKSSGLSRAEISKALRLPLLTVRDELERLRSLEMVETYGYGRGAVWHLKNS